LRVNTRLQRFIGFVCFRFARNKRRGKCHYRADSEAQR